MPIANLFFDIGGVLLTNGWDEPARKVAVQHFGLDPARFERNRQEVATAFETGALNLDGYLDRVVFDAPRSFSRDAFRDFMFAGSKALPGALEVVAELAASGKYWMATLNNEPYELNQMRIERFGLNRYFQAFFSSCWMGVAKPDPRIFRGALGISQKAPAESLFIDDRAVNLPPALALGMQTLHCVSAVQLRADLKRLLAS